MDQASSFLSLFRAGQNANAAASSPNIPGLFPAEEQRAPSPQRAARAVVHNICAFFIRPVAKWVAALLYVFARLLRFLYFFESGSDRVVVGGTTSLNTALMSDPIRRAEQFVQDLEERLLPQQHFSLYHSDLNVAHLPPFFQGSYTQALYMATQRAKFLFIYLTNPHNEGSSSVFERIVTNQKFISIFANNDQAIIWGGDLANPEAYQLANSLNITKFPVLGLLCLTRTTTMTPQGPQKTTPRISLISKIQGGVSEAEDADGLIHSKFIKRMMKYDPELSIMRAELRGKFLNDAMRQKQDLDYQHALLNDRRKKEEKRRKALAEKYLQWKQPYIRDLVENEADGTNTARVAIKFEDGKRVTVNFPKDCPISDIFLLVELTRRNMLDTDYGSVDERELADFVMSYEFKLTSSVPPRPALNDLDMLTPIDTVSYIYPSGLLMVEKI